MPSSFATKQDVRRGAELGRGGMGRVLRAYDSKLQREVALKVLHARAFDPVARGRLVREARAMAEHPEVATIVDNLGNVHYLTGDHGEAKVLFERALASREKVLGPEHPDLAFGLVGLANVALAQHRPGDAVPLAERALRLRENGDVAAEHLTAARLVLARALWDAPEDAGRDRARARRLAEQARDELRARGETTELAEAEQWLADHPRVD